MAHIRKHYSLAVAEKVLRAANSIGFSGVAARLFSAEAWDGCREQGLCLSALLTKGGPPVGKITPARVFIAEQRNSDAILVVVDDDHADGIDNKPSEKAWEDGTRTFRATDVTGAAQYVVDSVHSLVANHHEEV